MASNAYTEYEWDHRNRLTAVKFFDHAGGLAKDVRYTYDVNDLRIGKHVSVNGSAVSEAHYVYENGELVYVLDGNQQVTHRYLHGPAVDQVLADEAYDGSSVSTGVTWPLTDHQGTGGALGVTDKFGNITIKPGLAGTDLVETVRHEAVHRFFSARPGVIGNVRADIGMAGYQQSHLVRFLEEGIAESVATGSLRRGFAFPLTHEYVSGSRVLMEGVGYATIVGGTAYGAHELMEDD